MTNCETRIPRYLNSQAQILWWELDEALILTASIGVGILYELLPLTVPLGLLAARALARNKANRGHGWLLHAAWHRGIPLVRLRIPSTHKEFLG
jgi:type IV conjugative transfer system protein TraL